MMKHIALGLALLMGACAFAQAPAEAAKPLSDTGDKFAGIESTVQLVKLRKQLLQENDAAVEDQSNDSDKRLHGSYVHVTQGYMTTPEWLAELKARNAADALRVKNLDQAIAAAKDRKAARALEHEKATIERRIAQTEQDLATVTEDVYEPYNYYKNPKKGGQYQLCFPDLVGKQIDLPQVTGVIHSHQVGDWNLTASRIASMWSTTGIMGFTLKDPAPSAPSPEPLPGAHPATILPFGLSQLIMIVICLVLIYLAIVKEFEPLLLLPIGFGGLLANIPYAGITAAPLLDTMGNVVEPGGFLYYTFDFGVNSGLFPILIFMGVGAMTDFGPLIANPRTALLGAAAQLGIFTALLGALALTLCFDSINFFITDAASIGIIGGADGPTAIWLTTKLSPDLLGAIAVAAYSYMALVPVIQPPIMKLCTNKEERLIKMKQLRPVTKMEKVLFPITVLLLCAAFLPSAAPLIGAVMLGNLAKECGVVDRISDTMANSLINIVTILLGLSVGSKLAAEKFLTFETLGILVLGVIAFGVGTAGGVWMAKLMNLFVKDKINPLIGSAGVSAVPMAARVSNKVGLEYDPTNFLLMHAMGPNVSGVIGSAVVAGVLYFCCR